MTAPRQILGWPEDATTDVFLQGYDSDVPFKTITIMARMNSEMYGANGKVGNKTYYQVDGKTVAREIVTPKNPKTDAQTLQRILVKVVGMLYALLKAICNHSFEGFSTGSWNLVDRTTCGR